MEICNEQLITAVQAHECLYDKRSPLYKNKAVKESAWEAVAGILNNSAYNCKTRWRSLCDRNRREIAEDGGRSGSGSSSRKPWKLKNLMAFVNDAGEVGSTFTNVEYLEEEVTPAKTPQRGPSGKRKTDDLFEDVLIKMQRKYESVEDSQEDETFFALLRSKFSRLSSTDKDEIQAEILQLVANKIKRSNQTEN